MENKISSRRKRSTPSERQQLLEAFDRSGLTQREFALQNGIGLSTFHAWLGQRRRQPKPSFFIEAPNLLTNTVPAPYRFNFSNGFSLDIHPGFRPEELAFLLKLAQTI